MDLEQLPGMQDCMRSFMLNFGSYSFPNLRQKENCSSRSEDLVGQIFLPELLKWSALSILHQISGMARKLLLSTMNNCIVGFAYKPLASRGGFKIRQRKLLLLK